MTKHKTREAWLNDCAKQILAQHYDAFEGQFGEAGIEHLSNLHVSTGFPSRGGLTKVIGECWSSKAADDGVTHHIFINPRLTDLVEVVATLAHEMIHAADDGQHKHKGPFVRCARAIGLDGKPTATEAGEEFADWVKNDLAKRISPYPHTGLIPTLEVKKQGTRMLKLEATDCCGYVVRTTQKWIDEGYPACPHGNEMQEA